MSRAAVKIELSPEETDKLNRWLKSGKRVRGLEGEQRSGCKVINAESVERRILDQLAEAPPQGFARWNGRLVAEALGDVSDDAVWPGHAQARLAFGAPPEFGA